jgi:hypothetical protein
LGCHNFKFNDTSGEFEIKGKTSKCENSDCCEKFVFDVRLLKKQIKNKANKLPFHIAFRNQHLLSDTNNDATFRRTCGIISDDINNYISYFQNNKAKKVLVYLSQMNDLIKKSIK